MCAICQYAQNTQRIFEIAHAQLRTHKLRATTTNDDTLGSVWHVGSLRLASIFLLPLSAMCQLPLYIKCKQTATRSNPLTYWPLHFRGHDWAGIFCRKNTSDGQMTEINSYDVDNEYRA